MNYMIFFVIKKGQITTLSFLEKIDHFPFFSLLPCIPWQAHI